MVSFFCCCQTHMKKPFLNETSIIDEFLPCQSCFECTYYMIYIIIISNRREVGGLNCAASSLLIAYYKFIPHACLSLGKSLSFVLCFRTMHDLLFCLNFLLVFFKEETNFLLVMYTMQVNLISLFDLISCVII